MLLVAARVEGRLSFKGTTKVRGAVRFRPRLAPLAKNEHTTEQERGGKLLCDKSASPEMAGFVKARN